MNAWDIIKGIVVYGAAIVLMLVAQNALLA